MTATLDNTFVFLEIKEEVLICTYKKGLKVTIEIAESIVEQRLAFTKNKSMPIMILNHGVISIDKKARDFFSSSKGTRGLKAAALVLNTPFGSFLANFLISVTKPAMPAKIFSTEEAAMQWLKKFV
jgi:hypothetical protein